MFLNGDTVVIVRPLGRDSLGNTNAGVPTEKPVAGCGIAQGASVEPIQIGRETVVTDFQVFMPAGTDILAGDQLRIHGRLCDVVGTPWDVKNPFTGWTPGVDVHANIGEG